jgi:hypothetical protein
MKHSFIMSLILMLAAGDAFTQRDAPIVGTWQLVSAVNKDGTLRDSSTIAQYKVITPQFFMVSAFKKGADAAFIGTTTGTVTYNGKEMTHTATYSTVEGRVGVTGTFKVEVKGNNLYMKGTIGKSNLDEVWVKIN